MLQLPTLTILGKGVVDTKNMLSKYTEDFPGSSMVTTSPSNAGGMGSIPSQGTRFHMPCGIAKLKKKKTLGKLMTISK